PSENRAHEAEKSGKAYYSVNHAAKRLCRGAVERRGKHAAHDISQREKSSKEGGGVPERDANHMGCEPAVGIEDGTHHLHRVAIHREMVGSEESYEADHCRRCAPNSVPKKALQANAEQHRAPADENRGGI